MTNLPLFNKLKKLSLISRGKIYLVGGCVRNYFLFGSNFKTDIDICGQLSAAEMFDDRVKTICVNKNLGTYKIIFEGIESEYTPFRSESYTNGNHLPDKVVFGCDLTCDALRRDFTVNAIYYDLTEEKIIDPLCGLKDIEARSIRQISYSTLAADGLRLMRAVRFAAQLGFSIEETTMSALKANAYLIKDISPERVRDELKKILSADCAYGQQYAQYRGLELLKETGVLSYIIPELSRCDGVKQNPKYHAFDVLEHIFQTVKFSAPDIRLPALFHDVAKPVCLDGAGHMKGHDIVGAEMAGTIMRRLRFTNAEINETTALVRAHMFDLKGEASESKVRLFIVKNFEYIDKIIKLKRADAYACGMENIVFSDRLQKIKEKVLADGTPITINDLNIGGEDIINLGASGSLVGEILEILHRDCILNPKLNNRNRLISQAEKMVKINKRASNKI